MAAHVLVWAHLVAAVVWIGGMVFLSLVLVPVLKCEPFAAQRGPLIKTAAGRFRAVVWGSVFVLLATGPLLAQNRGLPLADPSAWPSVLAVKVTLVVFLLALTAAHDLWLGPRLSLILQQPDASRSDHERRLVAWASWLPRISLLIALAVLFAAVSLARTQAVAQKKNGPRDTFIARPVTAPRTLSDYRTDQPPPTSPFVSTTRNSPLMWV